MPQSMYRCSKCQIAVIVIEGEVIKACSCESAIVAEARASVTGVGGLKAR